MSGLQQETTQVTPLHMDFLCLKRPSSKAPPSVRDQLFTSGVGQSRKLPVVIVNPFPGGSVVRAEAVEEDELRPGGDVGIGVGVADGRGAQVGRQGRRTGRPAPAARPGPHAPGNLHGRLLMVMVMLIELQKKKKSNRALFTWEAIPSR